MSLGQRRMDQGVHSVLETFLNCSGAKGSSAIEGRFNPLLKFKFSTARLKKPWRTGKLETMRCRVNFFKDLVSSDGQPSSRLQQSMEISGAENIDRAVEEAKRRYERLCRVPLWSLYADRLEVESDGKRTSYRPTHDESALIPIPGRRKAVSDFAIGS
jgi:hypothetical protein